MRGKIAKQIRKMAKQVSVSYNDCDIKENKKKFYNINSEGKLEPIEVITNVRTLQHNSAKYLTKNVKKWYKSLPSNLKHPGKYMMMFDVLGLVAKPQ